MNLLYSSGHNSLKRNATKFSKIMQENPSASQQYVSWTELQVSCKQGANYLPHCSWCVNLMGWWTLTEECAAKPTGSWTQMGREKEGAWEERKARIETQDPAHSAGDGRVVPSQKAEEEASSGVEGLSTPVAGKHRLWAGRLLEEEQSYFVKNPLVIFKDQMQTIRKGDSSSLWMAVTIH